MPTGIPTGNILQPGAVAMDYANRQLISDLQLLTPQFYNKYVEKYGNEDFTWWLATFGGMELVKNRDYFWFENRGKLNLAVTVNAQVTPSAPGATVTVTLSPEDHYDEGTMSALREQETVYIASSNVQGKILSVNKTTADAFTFTVRPSMADELFASAGSTNLEQGEILIFGGRTEAGEASGSVEAQVHLDSRFENSITEIHDTWSASDLAEMAEVFYNTGVSGSVPAGGEQSGTGYFTYKGLVMFNTRFKNMVESRLIRGDKQTNTGLTNSVGTQGIIPAILERGETVGVTPGTFDIAKFHEITRIMDVNGCAKENLFLMDTFMRQSFSDGIFKEFPAGAWVWGQNEKSEQAAIQYGVQSIKIDEYLFKAKKYSQWNTEVTTGKTPTVDFFRNFGVICPQGTVRDARDSNKVYKNITIMYQQPQKGGTTGNGIRVWQHGGGSVKATNGTLRDNIEMVTYRGSRVAAANQFIICQD